MASEPAKRRKNRRKDLLDAAIRLFGQRGYHATTIDNITEEAGVTRGALYWHFKSKSDLLEAVFESLRAFFLERLIRHVEQAGSHPLDRLWAVFKFNARFAVEFTDLVHCLRTLSLELSRAEAENKRTLFDILNKQHNLITNIIQEGQSAGCFRTDLSADLMTSSILAIHDGIVLQLTVFPNLLDGRDAAWALRQITLAGIDEKAGVVHPMKTIRHRKG